LGAAIGAALAGKANPKYAKDLITVIVGDGTYIFGIPSAAFWMARRYDTVSQSKKKTDDGMAFSDVDATYYVNSLS
jgi:hypothetical protein